MRFSESFTVSVDFQQQKETKQCQILTHRTPINSTGSQKLSSLYTSVHRDHIRKRFKQEL